MISSSVNTEFHVQLTIIKFHKKAFSASQVFIIMQPEEHSDCHRYSAEILKRLTQGALANHTM
jgi:hypothetical protein